MGFQSQVNSVIGTVAIASKLGEQTQKDIAQSQAILESEQLQGQLGMTEDAVKAYQHGEQMMNLGAEAVSEGTYETLDDSGNKVVLTHSEVKAKLAERVNYQQALAKAAQNSKFRNRVLALGGSK